MSSKQTRQIKNAYLSDGRHSLEFRAKASARRKGVECTPDFIEAYRAKIEKQEQESRERRKRQILRSQGFQEPNRRTRERLGKQPPNTWNEDLGAEYGITEEEYNALLKEQHGVCPVCGRTKDRAHRVVRLQIDQCPKTGRVQGLLCARCRKALELLGNWFTILSAAHYYMGRGRS